MRVVADPVTATAFLIGPAGGGLPTAALIGPRAVDREGGRSGAPGGRRRFRMRRDRGSSGGGLGGVRPADGVLLPARGRLRRSGAKRSKNACGGDTPHPTGRRD